MKAYFRLVRRLYKWSWSRVGLGTSLYENPNALL